MSQLVAVNHCRPSSAAGSLSRRLERHNGTYAAQPQLTQLLGAFAQESTQPIEKPMGQV